MITKDEIINQICLKMDICELDFKSKKRKEPLPLARHIYFYIMRVKLGETYISIQQGLNIKQHGSIIHGVKKIESMISENIYSCNETKKILKELLLILNIN